MDLPILPKEDQLVDKNGKITLPWRRFFQNFVALFNEYLSDDGYKMAVINKPIEELKQTGIKNLSTFFYLKDAVSGDNDKLLVNVNGTLKKITVTDL